VIAREPAEFASAIVAEEAGVPHVQIGIGLVSSHAHLMSMAAEAVDGWRAGLMEAIAATPYLTLFPASIEDPDVPPPAATHRFRDPGLEAPPGTLPDWWAGDARPLVYVTFGSVAASAPMAAPIYAVAGEAVADLPARVLLTTGPMEADAQPQPPGPHVHVAEWVPQADVLPHASVVVCHGGSGTTLGTLAAGVPLVFTPLFADQPENARRVAAAGAGVVVGPRDPDAMRSAIDPEDLRGAIAAVLADDGYARSARAIADEIRALPPADAALAVFERVA
jgi:UDP:flavonoid glycosyltransferase YjiC (YdhE family)